MAVRKNAQPRCIIIAGPNGAGKTTFARTYLMPVAGVVNFLNADLIAAGLSPFRPERASRAAGRILLEELERLVNANEDFALESTLSGRSYIQLFKQWKERGYRIEIIFLKLPDPDLAISRIASRVKQGGHHVPTIDVIRRFERGWNNFQECYQHIADAWWVYDISGDIPLLLNERS